MDLSGDAALSSAKVSRKRPRSPDSEYSGASGHDHILMATKLDPTNMSIPVGMKNKRRRISGRLGDGSCWEPQRLPPGGYLTLQDLPSEILQHVCTFVDPISLGRLLSVNRSFRSLIDPACPLPQRSSTQSKLLPLRRQDLIWTISRKTFFLGFPKPMERMTELDMWRLVWGSSCQYCGKKSTEPQSFSLSEPWNSGPGVENVRPIWPFRVRSCGSCLRPRLIKVNSSDAQTPCCH